MLHHVKTILSVSVWFLIVSPAPSQSLFNYVGVISWAQGARELGGPISGGRKGNNSGPKYPLSCEFHQKLINM